MTNGNDCVRTVVKILGSKNLTHASFNNLTKIESPNPNWDRVADHGGLNGRYRYLP